MNFISFVVNAPATRTSRKRTAGQPQNQICKHV